MRRSLLFLCAICGTLVGTHVDAQPPGAGRGSDSGGTIPGQPSRPPRSAPPKDEDLRQIQLEVAILDVPAAEVAAGPLTDAEQLARLGRLETEGKLAGVQRMKTTLVANQVARFQMGETVQIVTGRNRSPNDPTGRGGFPGGFNETRSAQQVGTMVTVTARPIAGGAVAEIQLERSGIVPAKQPDAAEGAPNDYPKSRTMTISTTVLFTDGETKIVSSHQQAKADGKEETWVLAKITVGDAGKPQLTGANTIKIFSLTNSRAEEVVRLIQSLYGPTRIRAVADVRTNSVIVASAPSDELDQIAAILERLDKSDAGRAGANKLEPTPDLIGNDAPRFVPNPARKVPTGFDPLDKLDPSR